ncbi:MAG: Gfo/Idh/MocA family oxidoreductase [Planctomycetaceae bacterium]
MSVIRWGTLGCGRIVRKGFLPGVKAAEGSELYAVASLRPGVAEEVRQQTGAAVAYNSYEELLADPHVDAVYVPCTGDLHERWTIAAAKGGKHVLCEKPLSTSLKSAITMEQACREQGVLLMEAFMWRHHPRATRLKRWVDEGAIGPLRNINVSFSFSIDRNDWRMRPERGGGAMWDIGAYGVNAARFLTGEEPIDLYARGHWSDTGVDLSMNASLVFPKEVLVNIDCSFAAPFRCRLEVVGESGRIELNAAFQPIWDRTLTLWRSTDREAIPEVYEVEDVDQYACQVTHFANSIRAGKLLPPAESGVANMRVMSQLISDAQQHRVPASAIPGKT